MKKALLVFLVISLFISFTTVVFAESEPWEFLEVSRVLGSKAAVYPDCLVKDNITLGYEGNEKYFRLSVSSFHPEELSDVKKILKVFFPTGYEETYAHFIDGVENRNPTRGWVVYDGREILIDCSFNAEVVMYIFPADIFPKEFTDMSKILGDKVRVFPKGLYHKFRDYLINYYPESDSFELQVWAVKSEVLNDVQLIFKVYCPTQHGEAYADFLKALYQNQDTNGVVYDEKIFDFELQNNRVLIRIRKNGEK